MGRRTLKGLAVAEEGVLCTAPEGTEGTAGQMSVVELGTAVGVAANSGGVVVVDATRAYLVLAIEQRSEPILPVKHLQ